MKNLKTLILTATVALSLSANAHDPSMHAQKEPAKADCTSYHKMVESGAKMDMTDPVMLAMMKKCKNQKADTQHDNSDGHHNANAQKSDSKCGDMSDGHPDKMAEKKCGDTGANNAKGDSKCGSSMQKEVKKTTDHGEHDH
ncbi:MAG TPA: hypothetical protein ENJ41_07240 [Oceanospirillales bacterium]|nr:hypothetical protein [Oceanospirillales bacterium]